MKKSLKFFDVELLMKKFKEYEESKSISIRNEIVEMNVPLVKYVVTKYFGDISVDVNELISLGYFGLINAVETYDSDYGASFSTYATSCILNYIKRELYTVTDIRNFRNNYPVLKAISLIEKAIGVKLDDYYDDLESILSEITFINDNLKERIRDYYAKRSVRYSSETVDGTYEIEDGVIIKVLGEELDRRLDTLPEIQREALRLGYGFYGECFSASDIGRQYGYTHQTILNKQNDAIYKLRKEMK